MLVLLFLLKINGGMRGAHLLFGNALLEIKCLACHFGWQWPTNGWPSGQQWLNIYDKRALSVPGADELEMGEEA